MPDGPVEQAVSATETAMAIAAAVAAAVGRQIVGRWWELLVVGGMIVGRVG